MSYSFSAASFHYYIGTYIFPQKGTVPYKHLQALYGIIDAYMHRSSCMYIHVHAHKHASILFGGGVYYLAVT